MAMIYSSISDYYNILIRVIELGDELKFKIAVILKKEPHYMMEIKAVLFFLSLLIWLSGKG